MNSQKAMMSKPVAVLISDVHYSLPTLKLADAAMRLAIAKANSLKVPLIVAGDLHDTKANMRAECVNAMIDTLTLCDQVYIMVGNHDRIHEKSQDHALNFLNRFNVIDKPMYDKQLGLNSTQRIQLGLNFIPYQHDPAECRKALNEVRGKAITIMHQGIQGSNSGEYIQDKSAINPEDVAGMRVISGHYHTCQDIVLPDGGLWSYIGNPYTLNYAEANDPPKGFQILMDDGSLEFVPTNLRKHVVVNCLVQDGHTVTPAFDISVQDLVWVKVSGTKQELATITKDAIKKVLNGFDTFRIDLIPTDLPINTHKAQQKLSGGELVDSIIDQLPDVAEDRAIRLKTKWKALCE
jgi:DNA repair exonuclease SbcCD nuclease subunit